METPPLAAAPPDTTVPARMQALFRAEALEHYRQRHSAAVLPRFTSGRRFVLLWLLVALLLAGVAGIASALHGQLFPS
jgi:hypothetical protein